MRVARNLFIDLFLSAFHLRAAEQLGGRACKAIRREVVDKTTGQEDRMLLDLCSMHAS